MLNLKGLKWKEPEQLPLSFEQPLATRRARKRPAGTCTSWTSKTRPSSRASSARRKLVNDLFGFVYKLKTGKLKAATNAGGLFLKTAGLLKK